MNDTALQTEKLQHCKRWTPEERGTLLQLIAVGHTIESAAKELGRTHKGVDTELKDIRKFYGALTLPHMIYIACKEGIIDIKETTNGEHQ